MFRPLLTNIIFLICLNAFAGFGPIAGAGASGNDVTSPSTVLFWIEEFLGFATQRHSFQWSESATNSGSAATSDTNCPATNGHVGYVNAKTNTNAAGGYMNRLSPNMMELVGNMTWETSIYLNDLSDATESYAFPIGMTDFTGSGVDGVDGLYFIADTEGVAMSSAVDNWWAVSANGGVRTETDTSTAIDVDAWVRLTITVNAAADSVTYSVNGTVVATLTTNLPASGRQFSAGIYSIQKSNGTTNRSVCIDYISQLITSLSR